MIVWLIILGGALVFAIIMLALDWSGLHAALTGVAIGVIVGVIIMIFTKNPTALYIAPTICIALGIVWHFIVKLAVGRG